MDAWVLLSVSRGYCLELLELHPLLPPMRAVVNINENLLHTTLCRFYLRFFNKKGRFLPYSKFKSVKCSLSAVVQFLEKGNRFAELDLQDVYFHIQIHKHYRKYLRFNSWDFL